MTPNLDFVRPGIADWQEFLAVAGTEGWKVPLTERGLFQGPLADSARALRHRGRFAGMVTFVNHGASAWIGNLIVRPSLRGQGFGKLLFDRALQELTEGKAASVWLTASDSGYPLYQRRGFETVGRVERWVLAGSGAGKGEDRAAEAGEGAAEELRKADAWVWGGRRPLLDYLLPTGRLFACGRSLALVQREPELRILGPWYAVDVSLDEQRRLLSRVAAASGEGELVADVLAGAVPPGLLGEAGFVRRGVTRLMVRGEAAAIRLESLVSLASLGSMG